MLINAVTLGISLLLALLVPGGAEKVSAGGPRTRERCTPWGRPGGQ